MEILSEVLDDPTQVFNFPNPDKLKSPLLKIEDGSFYYEEDHVLLRDLTFVLDMDSRVAIVGANGAGKTTFLKLLVNDL